jgi:hypothetical protein
LSDKLTSLFEYTGVTNSIPIRYVGCGTDRVCSEIPVVDIWVKVYQFVFKPLSSKRPVLL